MRGMFFLTTLTTLLAASTTARAQGYDSTPRYRFRPPQPTIDVRGVLGIAGFKGEERAISMGATGIFDLRIGKTWGLWAGASYLQFRPDVTPRVTPIITVVEPELAVYYGGARPSSSSEVGRTTLAAGFATAIPLSSPGVPSAFFAPFLSVGTLIIGVPVGSAALLGLSVDVRVGYRIPLTSGTLSTVDGLFIDARSGIGLAFL